MGIKDIARAGLKGRKKDSLLISLVITLAFIFIVTSTIFQSSIEKTRLEQATKLYGKWHAAYLDADEEILEELKKEKDIDKIGSSLIIGESNSCGLVATFDEDLLDMSRFTLYKGRYPTADNEIMLELNQMSKMGLDLELGQKISVNVTIPKYLDLIERFIARSDELREEGAVEQSTYYEMRAEYGLLLDEYRQILDPDENIVSEEEKEKRLEENYMNLDKLRMKYDLLKQEGLGLVLEEYRAILDIEAKNMEEEKEKQGKLYRLEDSLEYFMYVVLYSSRPTKSYKYHEVPFENIGDVTVVVSNSYVHYYLDGDYVSPEIIREKGVLAEQTISLKREFIITGILDSYSDKWDIGNYKLANAFMTEEGGKYYTNAFYNNSIEDFSDHQMNYNIFLYSDLLKDDLYANLASKYPDRDKYSKEYYTSDYVDYYLSYYMGEEGEVIRESLRAADDAWDEWVVERGDDQGKDSTIEGIWDFGEKMEVNNSNFRKNSFSYADTKGSTEDMLSLTIIGVIFVATALAIFQIFLTQMKRRSRKLVLLKSIGATRGQIIKIILYEGLYFLRNGLLIGIPIGFVSAISLIYGMNRFGGRDLHFFLEPYILGFGILAGILSLFIGMVIPMIFAVRIPLVGTLSMPPKHRKKDIKNRKIAYQSFPHINWQYMKLNKGKTLISFGISFITITILLSTVLLSYSSFNKYKGTVLESGRPDYAMEAIYGESNRQLLKQGEELMEIEGVKSTEVYKIGKQLYLWYEGIENNEILRDFENLLPMELRKNYFSKYNSDLQEQDQDIPIKNAFLTKIYGIQADSKLLNKYRRSITEGELDLKKFKEGQEVIIMVPMYLEGNRLGMDKKISRQEVLDRTNEDNRMNFLFEYSGIYKQSYEERYSKYYGKQAYIKPGDTVYLSSDKEEITGDSFESVFVTKELKVGGIIYYYPQGGAWPFSTSKANYIVISSIRGMENIYPFTTRGLKATEVGYMRDSIDVLYPSRYGRTLWYINTDTINQNLILDSRLLAYAHNNNYTIYNYKESNARLYQEAFNNALIISLLGLTAAAIASIILYNTTISKLEQERNRIGILQSMGVTKREFSRLYIWTGAVSGLLALIISHLVLFGVMFFTSLNTARGLSMDFSGYMKDIFIYSLWKYPWKIHILLSIVFFIVTVLIYFIPSRKITNKYPVENIRSLSR
ncbi:MAG: FtsX-like permease family protein [Tissierellaceae bacterium]